MGLAILGAIAVEDVNAKNIRVRLVHDVLRDRPHHVFRIQSRKRFDSGGIAASRDTADDYSQLRFA